MEYYLGEIVLFSFNNFVPYGFLPCDGTQLNVTQNQALFSLLSYTYGGNGTTTFALPNLKGSEPLPGMQYCIVESGLYPVRE